MQEVVKAYKDKGDVKQVQSAGLHIGGERFIVIKADDRSIYGKKVRVSRITECGDGDVLIGVLGQGRCGSREDNAGDTGGTLPRACAAGFGGECGRNVGRLLGQCGILE
jgi:hypothetical protein